VRQCAPNLPAGDIEEAAVLDLLQEDGYAALWIDRKG